MLGPGSYTVIKTLTLDQLALEEFVDSLSAHCTPEFTPFPDYSPCEFNCAECDSVLGDKSQFLNNGGTEEMWSEMKELCGAICDTISICSSYYKTMLLEVSPGGYYGGVWNESGDIQPGIFPNSVFNEQNALGFGYLDWRHPYIPYRDGDGLIDSIESLDGILYAPQHLPSIDEFISEWKPSWAHSLVYHHPEYCFYRSCLEHEEYNLYEVTVLNTVHFPQALTKGYMNPLAINDSTIIPKILLNTVHLDPLFMSGEAGYSFLDSMKSWLENYQNTGLSIWDFAGLITGCSACSSSCDTLEFGNKSLLNSFTLDQQWVLYRSLYLGLRNRVLGILEAQWQIDNNCFNGCLDEQYAYGIIAGVQMTGGLNTSDSDTVYALNTSNIYDTLITLDSGCYFKNYAHFPVNYTHFDPITGIGFVNQVVPMIILYNDIDTCACRTVQDLYTEYNQNDMFGFTAYYNAKWESNLVVGQIVEMLKRCAKAKTIAGGHTSHPDRCLFDDPANYLPSQPNCDSAINNLEDNCAEACFSYVPYWKEELSLCISDTSIINGLISRLLAVCKLGCDPIHPMGSSSCPDKIITNLGDSSFIQIIQQNTSCNPYLISAPFPYDYKLANS
ncbi:MAG: hypothetical protein JKX73_08105, partial [Flavobacteriales bacterium]|nr:hypothetical protein [Flavobacteriales bacterium]